MASKLIMDCVRAILERDWKIAFIESATAGRMCSEFALAPDSGRILRGAICCYEIFVKEQFLHVPHSMISHHTPESREVTEALAKSGSKLFNTNVTVAVTGLTAPGGSETKEKPVGTMFLHVLVNGRSFTRREVFQGPPESIILQATDSAAGLILDAIKTIKN